MTLYLFISVFDLRACAHATVLRHRAVVHLLQNAPRFHRRLLSHFYGNQAQTDSLQTHLWTYNIILQFTDPSNIHSAAQRVPAKGTCVCARVFWGAALAVSQRYNCASLDIKIDTFHSLSIFLAVHPIGRQRLRKKTSLTNHSVAFVTEGGEIMLMVIHRISQITNLFHLKLKLLRWVAAEATVALKPKRRRGLNSALCLH